MGLRAKAIATLVLSSRVDDWVAATASGRKGLKRFSWVDTPLNPRASRSRVRGPTSLRSMPVMEVMAFMSSMLRVCRC
jgi:hypothetical protein